MVRLGYRFHEVKFNKRKVACVSIKEVCSTDLGMQKYLPPPLVMCREGNLVCVVNCKD